MAVEQFKQRLENVEKRDFIQFPRTFSFDKEVITRITDYVEVSPEDVFDSLERQLVQTPSLSDEKYWNAIVSWSRKLERHKRKGFREGAILMHTLVREQCQFDRTNLPPITDSVIADTNKGIQAQASLPMKFINSELVPGNEPNDIDAQTTANLIKFYGKLLIEQPALAQLHLDVKKAKDRQLIMGLTTGYYIHKVADWNDQFKNHERLNIARILELAPPVDFDSEVVTDTLTFVRKKPRNACKELEGLLESSDDPSSQLFLIYINQFASKIDSTNAHDIKIGALMMERIQSQQFVKTQRHLAIPIEQPRITSDTLALTHEVVGYALEKTIPTLLARKVEQARKQMYDHLKKMKQLPDEGMNYKLRINPELKLLLDQKAQALMNGEWSIYEAFVEIFQNVKKEQPALAELKLNENFPQVQRFIMGLVLAYYTYKHADLFPPVEDEQ